VILFRSSGDSATDLRKFQAPVPGRYRFRIAASAHNSESPLPMAVLLGNFVVSGNYSRHLVPQLRSYVSSEGEAWWFVLGS